MNFDQIVQKLEEEIKCENKTDLIKEYETQLSKNVEELSKNEKFFNLPLNTLKYHLIVQKCTTPYPCFFFSKKKIKKIKKTMWRPL